jgi:NADH-ubiquinone oxidoreductase chain 2
MYNDFIGNGLYIFGGLLWFKSYTLIFNFFIFLVTTTILSLTAFYPKKLLNSNNVNSIFNTVGEQQKIIEYPLIILFCISGAIFLISSSDIISIFLSIELQSYGLYLICSIYRNSEQSVSAGLTYFLLGGLSSCIILLGQSLLYLNTGNTSLENIYIIKSIYDTLYYNDQGEIINTLNIYSTYWNYIQYSLIILSVGFLFKISSAPFHFWAPDVYDAIPTIVTTFVAIIAKISILIFLLELVYYTNSNYSEISWTNNLLLSSILSLIIGSLLGLTQYRIKRLYAYSTISHMGFILLALAINTTESIQAFFFYLIQYSLSNLNAFIILIAIGYSLYNYVWDDKSISYRSIKEVNNSPIQLISQLKGYFSINPIMAVSLIITLFSFIGVPPLVGFFAKQMILTAAIDNGYIFITLIAILTSVISAVYYLVIVKNIFFEKSVYSLHNNTLTTTISSSLTLPISVMSMLLLLFMFTDINYYI